MGLRCTRRTLYLHVSRLLSVSHLNVFAMAGIASQDGSRMLRRNAQTYRDQVCQDLFIGDIFFNVYGEGRAHHGIDEEFIVDDGGACGCS